MFLIRSDKELMDCFRDQDQAEVFIPTDLGLPKVAKDYLTWMEPSGARAYLVFQDESFKSPFGIVFRRDQTAGPSVAAMCDWCHSVRSGNEIGVLTVSTSSKKRVGISLCRDLSCAVKIRSEPSANDFPVQASTQERIRRLLAKMAVFARRELV
jgi:hypothetical protein